MKINNEISIRLPFLLSFLGAATIVTVLILNPIKPKQTLDQNPIPIKLSQTDNETCDLFNGSWIPDIRGPSYTNWSCPMMPDSKNCFKHGRKDRDFLNWRWKPNGCELPRFNAKIFLSIVRGKKMAFIGDSVARNHMESLLCLLSQEEIPKDMYKDGEDRFRVWYFPTHDFTLTVLWTKYLISANERILNGTSTGNFDLHIDKIDQEWGQSLQTLDYAIISAGHWFFRKIYLYEYDKLIGCVYCNDTNVTVMSPAVGLRNVFRTTFEYINSCKDCKKGLVTLLRTFSPAHFENGAWNTGGNCERIRPYGEEEIVWSGMDWEFRSIQIEEIERARKEGEKNGIGFRVLDVTKGMLMRPDGHPSSHWNNEWMKGYNDCVHWCLPGPIDAWNDFLMVLIGKEVGIIS